MMILAFPVATQSVPWFQPHGLVLPCKAGAGLESNTIEFVNNDDAQRAVRILKANILAYGQVPQASQQVQSIESLDIADQIKKLAGLKDQGLLSEDEFREAKRKILDRLGS